MMLVELIMGFNYRLLRTFHAKHTLLCKANGTSISSSLRILMPESTQVLVRITFE